MTQIQHLHIQTYKKGLVYPALIILCCFGLQCPGYAVEFGEIRYNDAFIDYSKIDKGLTLELADFYFDKALKTKNPEERKKLLHKASGEYFILTKAEPKNLYPIVQMARVYDYEQENSFAKAYFFQALKIDKNNADTNYYFGEYYYARKDYKRAIYFYNKAFDNGYRENFNILIKMALMYEKLGDLLRANQYYKKAFLVKPNSQALPDKIIEIESVNYKNTGYYNRQRKQ